MTLVMFEGKKGLASTRWTCHQHDAVGLFLLLVSYAKQIGRVMGAILLAAFTANIVIAFT